MISRIRRIVAHPAVKAAYLILLVGTTFAYLLRWGNRVPDLVGQVRPVYVAGAFLLTYLSAFLYNYINHYIYQQVGVRTSYWVVFRIVSISQLGKYLPGRLFFVGNFYLFSREAGIGNLEIGANFVISMAMWMLTASLCGLPILSLLESSLRYSVLILPLLLVLLIQPRILGWLLATMQRIAQRMRSSPATAASSPTSEIPEANERLQGLLRELGAAFYARVGFLYLATWALAGLGAYFSVAAFLEVEPSLYPMALASIALGTVVGFLALFAPVGLGVREGIGAFILSPTVGADVALVALLLLRGITVVVDLSLALAAMLYGRLAAAHRGPVG